MPIFAKLLDASVNPRKVVAKRDFRISDYSRYVTVRDNKRAIDKALLHNAREFTALHAQLMDELPAFLEGYMRILDIAMIGFAGAQARYHATVRDRIAAFAEKHARPPRRLSNASDVINLEEQADLSDGRGIIKAWYESWHPYAEAMDHFQCTLPCESCWIDMN